MKLKDIIADIDDLLPKTDMHYGLLRRKPKDGTIKVIILHPLHFFQWSLLAEPSSERRCGLLFSIDQSRNNLINGILHDLEDSEH